MTPHAANMASADELSQLPSEAGVYQIRNLRTGQVYIGSSRNIRHRASGHVNALKHGGASRRLTFSVGRDGLDGHVFEVIELVGNDRKRFAMEQRQIEAAGLLSLNSILEVWRVQFAALPESTMKSIRAMAAIRSVTGSRVFSPSELAERYSVFPRVIREVEAHQ